MSVIVSGNNNTSAGRDVNVNSVIDNSNVYYHELREVVSSIRKTTDSKDKYEKARRFIDAVSEKATADVVASIAKILMKSVLSL